MPELDDNQKLTLSNISNKPSVFEHDVSEVEVKNKKNEICDLERKLMELERKMDNISVSSEDEEEMTGSVKGRLNFKGKS